MTYLTNAIAILFCGATGALGAWAIIRSLGWTPLLTALSTALLAMVFAFTLYSAGIALGKVLALRK